MKKNGLLPDDLWIFQTSDFEEHSSMPPLLGTPDAAFRDAGETFPLADAGGSTSALVISASKPVASIATLADYLVNGFWQYNNTPAHKFPANTISYNITGLNSSEQFLTLAAMQAWSEVANISFVQTSGAANITFAHNGTMQAYTSGTWSGSGAITSQTVNISTDWVTTDGGANDGKTGIDSYAYQTYIHEIGHALGLGHQGPYNGSASYSTNAVYANDTWQYSIMSYFSEPNYSGSSYRYVVTPQMADIYAVISMYGAATSTRTGDTVYGFNSNAGAVFNFDGYTSAPALTIYDSAGNDTLDASGYSVAQIIDLHPGAFSSIGGLVNNIGIALNAVIEKASGGSGNDKLIASDAGCKLSGGGGNDTILGGAGIDTVIYSGNKSNYTISYNASTQIYTVVDKRTGSVDGTDTVSGVDYFQFSDVTVASSALIEPPNLSAQVFPSSSSAASGGTLSISAFVVNYGTGPAGASTTKIYLSTDSNITTSDIVLSTINSGPLAVVGQSGYYDAQSMSVVLPANLASGTYYIGAMADYNNQIAERDETDNTYNVAPINITGGAPLPNLSAQVFPSSSSASAGTAVSVSTFVVNYGNGPAAASTAKIYLSTDSTITASDIVLATINSGSLAAVGQPGYYDAQNLSVTIPANLASGTYYIGAMADYNNQIAERDEIDNTYNAAQIIVTGGVPPPNLSAQIFPSSSSVPAGAAVSVSTFVVNYGNGPAGASTTKLYLSTDSNITTSDIVLATISSGSLAAVGQPGYYDAKNLSVTLPSNLASGSYYIGAIADYNNQIAEKDETDNTYNVAQIAVTGTSTLSLSAPPSLSVERHDHVAELSKSDTTPHLEQANFLPQNDLSTAFFHGGILSAFVDRAAAHSGFHFTTGPNYVASPLSEMKVDGVFTDRVTLTEHAYFPIDDNVPIHNGTWEVAQHQLEDFIIKL
jgi:subtilase family serine protease